MHNADVLVYDDSTVDDLIDIVEGTFPLIHREQKVYQMFVLL